ncbi:VWA-like domain-containing protein [Kitasatospora cineracea]|uniref:vWA domain-containing protein n=1 Tax=Kitasatospora cineracea TaxID=88074 RepID=UPI0036DB0C3E
MNAPVSDPVNAPTGAQAGARAGAPPLALDTEKLFAARLHAVRARPYLATALFAMHVVESSRVPTMAVDRHWRCYVSPRFVERTSEEVLASVWVHEVSHLLRDHARRGDRLLRAMDREGPGARLQVNLAADCEINDDAFGDGLVRIPDAVYPDTLRLPANQLMEQYARHFSLDSEYQHLVWLECGSGADGWEREWDLGPDGAHGLNDQERDLVRFRVARGITARPGRAPAGWRRWADEVFHPPQPWRQLLGAAIRSTVAAAGAGEDYSYGRPSRRSTSLPGVVLPSLRRRPPRVTVVVDTSGSVSDRELGSALLETAAILRALDGRRDLVSVISCDAAARTVREAAADSGWVLIGGGGTDLRNGFSTALRRRPAPDVIVALTDGQTPWPSSPPPCRTVIGLFPRPYTGSAADDEDNPDYRPDTPPDWAKVVTLS